MGSILLIHEDDKQAWRVEICSKQSRCYAVERLRVANQGVFCFDGGLIGCEVVTACLLGAAKGRDE